MVNNMAQDVGYLVSLNDEYLYSYANGGMYAPLRFTKKSIDKIEQALQTQAPYDSSCIKSMSIAFGGGRFILDTEFNSIQKCMNNLSTPMSLRTKTEMCTRHLCYGKCTDEFMQTIVAKNLLPETYPYNNQKQK